VQDKEIDKAEGYGGDNTNRKLPVPESIRFFQERGMAWLVIFNSACRDDFSLDGNGLMKFEPPGRLAEDRRDCYWLYVVTNCDTNPTLQEPIKDPARFPWHEVTKVAHYYLSVDALTQPMQLREKPPAPYGGKP